MKSRDYAVLAHGDQTYGSKPYVYHLDAVAEILKAYDSDIISIAYLHDVVEDTDKTVVDVAHEFGSKIASCVSLLTDEAGDNRKEMKSKTYAKMAIAGEALYPALIVKAADRLANVRECIKSESPKLKMYRDEHSDFQKAVYRGDLCEDIWTELNQLLT